MQINNLKLKKRKKKKTIGRGGKKGTYSGKGNKGQKARSGAKINPLFEGGRSTLTDHMKKVRGFKSIKAKPAIVDISVLEKKFDDNDVVNKESIIKSGILSEVEAIGGIKLLGSAEFNKKLIIGKEILLSKSTRDSIEKAGGKVEK